MTSGEDAEEIVERISGVTKNSIESHEEAAEIFAILAYILGGLSIMGLWQIINGGLFRTLLAPLP